MSSTDQQSTFTNNKFKFLMVIAALVTLSVVIYLPFSASVTQLPQQQEQEQSNDLVVVPVANQRNHDNSPVQEMDKSNRIKSTAELLNAGTEFFVLVERKFRRHLARTIDSNPKSK